MFYTNLFKEFSCIGGDCINTCCRRWQISVDNDTADFYHSLTDKYGELIKGILKQRDDNSYYLAVNEHTYCPMLTEDRLCGVYQMYGENRMSHTCRTFPRTTPSSPDGKLSIAMVNSQCEEVLRLMAEGKHPLVLTALSDEDKLIEKSNNMYGQVLNFTRAGLGLLQDTNIPFGVVIGSLIAMMVDLVPSVCVGDINGIKEKLDCTNSYVNGICQVLDELSVNEIHEFSWNTALVPLVGFADILFESDFVRFVEILPDPEKYKKDDNDRLNQIKKSFQSFVLPGIYGNERLFRKLIANLFLEYSMCIFEENAIDRILYEMVPRFLISLVIPSLWQDSVIRDHNELLPRLSMLQRVIQSGYISNNLAPGLKKQMSVDEGTYAIMFAGVLGH